MQCLQRKLVEAEKRRQYLYENAMKRKNLEIETMFPAEPMIIYGDEDQLAQVFFTLVDNARETMKEMRLAIANGTVDQDEGQGLLSVETRRDQTMGVIVIKDTGHQWRSKICHIYL